MRLNKYEKNMLRAQKRKAALSGKGLYVFRNNTSGDLFLPRPTKSGISRVGVHEEFQGDDYYMFMVQNNELRLVRIIQTAEQEDAQNQQALNESTGYIMSEKLITEQPPVVTNEGTVEFVQRPTHPQQKPLNEHQPQPKGQQPDMLLNENPLDGVEII